MSGKRRTDAELLAEAEATAKRYRERIATARDPDIRTIRKAQEVLMRRVQDVAGHTPLFMGSGIDLSTVADLLIARAMGEPLPEIDDLAEDPIP